MSGDGGILFVIRSLFRDEGVKKFDAGIRKSANSARRAVDSFQKVTAAMGTLGGQAGRVGGQIAAIFSSFAAGGVVGVAIAGITSAFGLLVKKMEEARDKAAETAKQILASFSGVSAALKGAFSLASSVAGAKSSRASASTAAFLSESATRSSAAVRDVRQGAAIAAANAATPEEARLIQLRAEVSAAKLSRTQSIESATVRRNAAGDRLAEATEAERLLRKEAATVDDNHASNIRRMENYLSAYDSGRTEFAERFWGGGWLYDKLGAKKTREDVAKALEAEKKARTDDSRQYALKAYKAESATFSASGALSGANVALDAAKRDRSVEIAEANLAAEVKKQSDAAKKAADAEKKAADAAEAKRKAQEESARVAAATNRKIADFDAAIAKARDAANAQASKIAALQGAVGGGQSVPEIIAAQGDDERSRASNMARARRNLLGKISTARRNGNDADLAKWQGMLDTLDGKNPAANKAAKLEAERDELRRKSAEYLKSIADKMAKLGL